MTHTALHVAELGKRYAIGHARRRGTTLRDRISGILETPLHNTRRALRGEATRAAAPAGELWALRDVSFDVAEGECVGIIGHNGAGKSTLLKILSRITEPTTGCAEVRGRVASLLEVGVGFHGELTGRENVFLSGAILGMPRREIQRHFDAIVDFAEIGELLDTPIKFYSSGMSVRLGFAIAAHLEPEILLTDEVLAVGDAAFQRKCIGKLGSVSAQGRTVLFVSHQLDMIQSLCDRCLLLSHGRVVADGNPQEVVAQYLQRAGEGGACAEVAIAPDPSLKLQVLGARVVGADGRPRAHFDVFDPISIEVDYEVRAPIEGANVCVEVLRNGAFLFQSFDTDTAPQLLEPRRRGVHRVRLTLPCPLLKSGRYTLSLSTGVANKGRLQSAPELLSFDVMLLSRPASFLSYSDRRPGSLVVPLHWESRTEGEEAP
jgi:lipopolysaccharide transport system ATP-binding protein